MSERSFGHGKPVPVVEKGRRKQTPSGIHDSTIARFPSAAGSMETGHTNQDDRRRLGNCFAGVSGVALATLRQRIRRREFLESVTLFRSSQPYLACLPIRTLGCV